MIISTQNDLQLFKRKSPFKFKSQVLSKRVKSSLFQYIFTHQVQLCVCEGFQGKCKYCKCCYCCVVISGSVYTSITRMMTCWPCCAVVVAMSLGMVCSQGKNCFLETYDQQYIVLQGAILRQQTYIRGKYKS